MSDTTKAVKLTKPQVEFLRETSWEHGSSASDSYQPARRLLELGFVIRIERRMGQPRWRINAAGREELERHAR